MVNDKVREKEAEPLKKTGETLGDTIIAFLNKTASQDPPLKIELDNLTIGTGPLQVTLNGTMGIQVVLPKA